MLRQKVKYADIVKPMIKEIAEQMRIQNEQEYGRKFKVKNIVMYSDEMRVEFTEVIKPQGENNGQS